ncbi:MAG: Rieske (2Fe-2S) protein [Armatimonadetes bacterium]|nr:Rieske (2Fe-2S) protein [Armatimonadota bacterium]
MDRRTLLVRIAQGIGLVVTGIVGIPALLLALSPVRGRRRPAWVPVAPLGAFPFGEVRQATVPLARDDWAEKPAEKAVYVWRPAPDQTVVFSRHCTDLSCPVIWDPGSERFFCPCHGGIFAKNGDRVAGPPRRPLWRYDNRVRDGILEIDLASLPPVT